VDVYQKKTKDLILTVPVPQPAVVGTQIQNIGSVRNRGLEATLDARLFDRANKTLTSGLVLTVERNECSTSATPVHRDGQRVRTGTVGAATHSASSRPAARHRTGARSSSESTAQASRRSPASPPARAASTA
jgi:outer membrane receptor protein involved in Fe transport